MLTMNTTAGLLAAASLLLCFNLASFARTGEDTVPLKWSVQEDHGYTIKNYPVTNMMDGNPATTWAGCLDVVNDDGSRSFDDSRVYGDGILGFKIKVYGSRVSHFAIIAGYAKSTAAFNNNSIPTQIAVYDGRCTVNDGGEFIDVDGNAAQALAVKDLDRTMKPQTVKLTPALEDTDTLWLVIYDVTQGARYNDLCISEITFFGSR